MRIDRALPAKVMKRFGQLRRLGARGLARTVYALMLGPLVYSLIQPAMDVRGKLVRRRVRYRSLHFRVDRLRARVHREVDPNRAPLMHVLDRRALRGGEAAELVEIDRRLGVRRVFGADRSLFVQALEASLDLAKLGCIPPVVAVDWEANAITWAFICGVRPTEMAGGSTSRANATSIEQSLLSIHRAGYALGKIREDGVLIGVDGTAVFVNLTDAIPLAGLSRDMSIHLRDIDSAHCNRLFGTQLITASVLRESNSVTAGKSPDDRAYAAIFIRDDIRWGRIWNTDVATGRWNYFLKDHLPIPNAGKILDLGTNNGFNPLQMLRRGAASAVGIELKESLVSDSEFLKGAFEWLDNRAYDFSCIHGSFADLPRRQLGRFDIVMALCSLYYVSEQQMAEIARYVRTLSNIFVLQCNTDRLIYREEEDQYRRASVEFAIEVLKQAGFAERRVIAPPGYSRPLVIGRAT